MILEEREKLLKERKGSLQECNLWPFWDGLTGEQQNSILDYFENTPLLFNYTTLFKGDWQSDVYHGMLSLLMVLFVRPDLNLADYFFSKFLEYTPSNYNLNSEWGVGWENKKVNTVQIWQRIVERSEAREVTNKLQHLESIKKLSIEDIYWCEAHSFVQLYSGVVYKSYLHGECDIERFKNAFKFCYNNIDRIKISITKIFGWETPLKNGIVEQYLIYLEKNKEFDQCIEIIYEVKGKGWSNDFEKRLNRCLMKKDKRQAEK